MSLVRLVFFLFILPEMPVEVFRIAIVCRRALLLGALVLIEAISARVALFATIETLNGARVLLFEQVRVQTRQVRQFVFFFDERFAAALAFLVFK